MSDWNDVVPYFDGSAVAHLATINEDGSPHAVAVWVGPHGDGELEFFMEAGSRKDRNLQRDPRFALSTTRKGNDFAMATVRGEVVERLTGDAAVAVADRLSNLYSGKDYNIRSGLAAYVVRPRVAWQADYS
ncbi:PPOX class probable F420-dependent enzyme [Microbacteriaceae bacterium SG_E_30_P1]|uniref:PPOX class probable F420-dependent enzyme n=1 Tax=Antiquaquibacter oligotrophicus TaxID=2880260 RepID=A0ABT6KRL1_9MICO|nr:pyridoxamine 5'-phosphate oxidase family protein [Antiquaquibacter oligotrophicus]MDH6181839.1 PPOX class probable F420-dependent enzyme [Antiquaquibacter oligotrophicus]UDF12484.1 pyridoxamine 5'-phosphate oxidase family protein [Antiquaquibacter oligotrophicus]